MRFRWEVAGVIFSFLAIAISLWMPFWQESRELKRIEISLTGSWDPLLCTGAPGLFSISYKGKETESLYLTFFTITNIGVRAITPEDFFEPLTVTHVLAGDMFGVVQSIPSTAQWTDDGNGAYAMTPTLLNPNETVIVSIASKSDAACTIDGAKQDPWHWSGRIRNGIVSVNGYSDNSDALSLVDVVDVNLRGVFVWVALLVSVALFYLTARLVTSINWKWMKKWSVILPVFVAAVSNGENAAYLSQSGWVGLWDVAKVVFIVHLAVLIVGWGGVLFRRGVSRLRSRRGLA